MMNYWNMVSKMIFNTYLLQEHYALVDVPVVSTCVQGIMTWHVVWRKDMKLGAIHGEASTLIVKWMPQ